MQKEKKYTTPRENEVLEHVLAGDGNCTIAAKLKIKEGTVKFHITNIFRAHKVTSRAKLMAKLLKPGSGNES